MPRNKPNNSKRADKLKQHDPVPLHPQDTHLIRSLSIILITFFGLNLARLCCLVALHPLFGSIATSYTFDIGVQSIDFFVAPLLYLISPNLSPSPTASNFLAAFLVWRAPDSFGRVLSEYSGRFDILRGPLLFQSLAYWPIRIAGMSSIYRLAIDLIKQFKPLQANKVVRRIAIVSLPLALHGASRLMLPLANACFQSIPAGHIFNLTPTILLATTVIGSMIEISQLQFKKTVVIKKINLIIFFGCILSAMYMPLPKNLSRELDLKTKSTGHGGNYRTLARRLSITGLVLVGEFTQESGSQFRFLRCDHSLLGGIWNGLAKKEILKQQMHASDPITTDELESRSVEQAEAIYPTFIVQTAVKLVERSESTLSVTTKKKPKALILGLGVGIAARSLMKQGVKVTIVEIDPLIYEYSRKYFALPTPNGGIFLEDARIYLDRNGKINKSELFDYVIHDVFTGGAVPSSLFTIECWKKIRDKLMDDGVLAVNFVGVPLSDAASMVLMTLFKIFPFCRAFSEDSGGPISETDFQNMLIFCSPTSTPKFRQPRISDVLGSSEYQLRVLTNFQKREVDLKKLLPNTTATTTLHGDYENEWILSDRNQSLLDHAQTQAGLHHWDIMRQALPHSVWNHYYHY